MYEKFGWNRNNMFFLTRDYPLPENDVTTTDRLLYYANQVLFREPSLHDVDYIDPFGRNYIDRMFILLCANLWVVCRPVTFKSLTCEKVNDRYIMRVRYDDTDLEMELIEMVDHFSKQS